MWAFTEEVKCQGGGWYSMLEEKKQWIRRRFGDIDQEILGRIEEVNEMSWPDIEKEFEVNGNNLRFRMIGDLEGSAERVAEIYRNGIDEIVGNIEYEWHHDPLGIIEKVQTGDWNIYGCYFKEKLISVASLHIIRGQRTLQWVWGAVDPVYRGLGVWQKMGEYLDAVTELSGAQMGIVWVVTTHKYSQIQVEGVGYRPIGCFIGGEFFGGSDNRYYRQNVIYYGKLYGDGKKHLQKWDTMQLTENSEKLAKIVREIWADAL